MGAERIEHMGQVVLQLLPLAAGAIAPTLVSLVVILLSSERGYAKAGAFILGKYTASLLWGFFFLAFTGYLTHKYPRASGPAVSIIAVLLGGLLVILSLRAFLSAYDPDAPPPKIMALLDKLGPGMVFGASFLWSLLHFRFIALLYVGAAGIAEAALPGLEVVLALLLLALFMIWPMLIPMGIFLTLGEQRRITAMREMRAWLERKRHLINGTLLGLVGLVLLAVGLSALLA